MSQESATQGRHMIVYGRVQRVGYRAFARRAARKLGLTGWVRNLPDGTVELVAHGPVDALFQLRRHLLKGPLGSRVSEIREEPVSPSPDSAEFEITYV